MKLFSADLSNLTPYFIFGITFLLIVVLAIVIVNLIYQTTVASYFSNKKFSIKSKHKVNPKSGEEVFELLIFNNNVNEARVLSFGFLYRSHSIDFFDIYLEEQHQSTEDKVIILSRDFIALEIEAKKLIDLIKDHNNDRVKVENIQAYVSDASGNLIKYNAREVRRIIQRHFKAVDKHEKDLAKQAKKEACLNKRNLRKSKWQSFWDRLFNKKNKQEVKVVAPVTEVNVEEKVVEKEKPKKAKVEEAPNQVETPKEPQE